MEMTESCYPEVNSKDAHYDQGVQGYKFQVGDIVKLKSGGPTMTVSSLAVGFNSEDYECTYYSLDKDSFEKRFFEKGTLEKVEK